MKVEDNFKRAILVDGQTIQLPAVMRVWNVDDRSDAQNIMIVELGESVVTAYDGSVYMYCQPVVQPKRKELFEKAIGRRERWEMDDFYRYFYWGDGVVKYRNSETYFKILWMDVEDDQIGVQDEAYTVDDFRREYTMPDGTEFVK